MEIIKLSNLYKTYGTHKKEVRVDALKNINLSFESGTVYAIMGPSGSGKSTLMHILGLLDRPTRGRYYLNDEDITTFNDKRLAHYRSKEIGFVFQNFNLLPHYSVFKNVELPLVYSATPPRERKKKIEDILRKVGLSGRMKHKPNELSGGEKQRVAIARALVNSPSILMADEPTGNLDSKTEEEILKLFMALKDQSRTIIIVTHDDSVAAYADKIVRIRDGEVNS